MIFGGHCSSAAPSTRTAPCAGRHTPTRARTSEVLPEPLGPIMPMTSPAASVKLTFPTIAVLPSGDMTATFSATRLRLGFGSAVRTGSVPTRVSTFVNLPRLSRAATNPRQFAIAISIGASARAIMIDEAIMAPGINSCPITR